MQDTLNFYEYKSLFVDHVMRTADDSSLIKLARITKIALIIAAIEDGLLQAKILMLKAKIASCQYPAGNHQLRDDIQQLFAIEKRSSELKHKACGFVNQLAYYHRLYLADAIISGR